MGTLIACFLSSTMEESSSSDLLAAHQINYSFNEWYHSRALNAPSCNQSIVSLSSP